MAAITISFGPSYCVRPLFILRRRELDRHWQNNTTHGASEWYSLGRAGMSGAGVLSNIAVAKYGDKIPLHRQSGIYTRQGVELSRCTLERLVDAIAYKLRPLYDELNRYLLQAGR